MAVNNLDGWVKHLGLGILLLGAQTACATLESRMQHVAAEPCPQVIADHEDIKADSGYRDVPPGPREQYEYEVARCYVGMRLNDQAIKAAEGFGENHPYRYMIGARVAARLGDEKQLRAKLQGLAEHGGAEVGFYLHEDFDAFRDHDWFLGEAVAGWRSDREPTVEEFLQKLLSRARRQLLPLRLAAADPNRRGGEWALWLGVVRHGQLDREKKQTLLFIEGAEVKKTLQSLDRRVDKVETTATAIGGNGFARAWATSVPSYTKVETYEEEFVPTGHRFLVRFDGINEQLVQLKAAYVLGRFKGRDPESGQPVLDAVLIQPRTPLVISEVSTE